MEIELEDKDYKLIDGAAWFTVGQAAIRIMTHADSGDVSCRIFQLGNEDGDPLTSCRAYSEDIVEK